MKKIIILESDYDMELYPAWIEKTGAEIQILPSWASDVSSAKELLNKNLPKLESANVIVFTGGSDINPEYFNDPLSDEDKKKFKTSWPDNNRDYIEHEYFKKARELKLPIFGICRGIQLINCILGGSLYYDLEEQTNSDKHTENPERISYYHDIEFDENSWAYKELGCKKIENMSSRHHQAVKKVAPSLKISAIAKDGVVEFLESKDPKDKIALIQGHPEFMEFENVNTEFTDKMIAFLKKF